MTSRQITHPANLAVSLDDARSNLRIDGDYMDDQITLWLKGIIAYAEGLMRRALVNQKWEQTEAAFAPAIRLQMSPVTEVTIKYFDADGIEQTVPDTGYRFTDEGIVTPVGAWPAIGRSPVTLTYICGYGDDDTTTPDAIKLYILSKLTEQFDPAIRLEKDTVQSSFVDRLLDSYVKVVYV